LTKRQKEPGETNKETSGCVEREGQTVGQLHVRLVLVVVVVEVVMVVMVVVLVVIMVVVVMVVVVVVVVVMVVVIVVVVVMMEEPTASNCGMEDTSASKMMAAECSDMMVVPV